MAIIQPGPEEIKARETDASSTTEKITQTTHPDPGGDKHALDVQVLGGVINPGLAVAGLITEVSLNAGSWTAIPNIALSGRNTVALQNPTNRTLLINFTPLAPASEGWRVNPNGEFFIDVTDDILLFARTTNGTADITVMELS